MPLDPAYLGALDLAEVTQTWSWRDAAIYALGLGYGDDPTDKGQLVFLDAGQGIQAMPAMVNVLCYDGAWLRDPATGIDYLKVVHGEQEMELFAPLPPEGTLTGRTVIEEIVDKGAGKGALLVTARELYDGATHVATVRHTVFCRGAGGFGGAPDAKRAAAEVPDRAPDGVVEIETPRQLALVYRLSGDLNPLHSDPDVARRAGFERPILHGLSTFGIACRALMAELAGNEPARVKRLGARFSAPVFPGDTIAFHFWRTGEGTAAFVARVEARGADVLKNGVFTYEARP